MANTLETSSSEPQNLGERLRAHAVLGEAPDWELAWVQAHGFLRSYQAGDLVLGTGEPVDSVYVVLSGRMAIRVEKAYGRRKIMEWNAGEVTGTLPYSRVGVAHGNTVAEEDTELFVLPDEHLPGLIQACPETTTLLVHVMVDRARRFTSSDLQDQKALALGKVASGLAHELNNPASALVRSVKGLLGTLERSRSAVRALAVLGLTGDEFSVIDGIKSLAVERESRLWGPLEVADREDTIREWMDETGAKAEEVGALAEAPIALDELGEMTTALPPQKRTAAMQWLACWLMASQLSEEIKGSSGRIFHLVSAVKGLTHMDRALNPEWLDPRNGIEKSLALLQEKARAFGVSISVEFPDELPKVKGVAGELSQVWHSLIDNAVDAAGSGGTVRVVAKGINGKVTVEVADDGQGIPGEIRDRIFDPFFTTKPVGQGVGLGLELVRRVVDQHRGEIEVRSSPGQTVFVVTLDTEAPPTH